MAAKDALGLVHRKRSPALGTPLELLTYEVIVLLGLVIFLGHDCSQLPSALATDCMLVFDNSLATTARLIALD